MRKQIFSFLLASLFLLTSCNKEDDTAQMNAAVVAIPDSSFKTALVSNSEINTNGNSEIEVSEAEAYTGQIRAVGLGITNATGIEAFVNVTRIALFENSLSAIDISKNTKVTQLLVEENQITAIDVSQLVVLTDFKAHSNNLVTVNLANGNNNNMTRMELQGNPNLSCVKVDAVPTPDSGWMTNNTSAYTTSACNE